MPHDSLEALLSPKSVALIGATNQPGSVGAALLANLTNGLFHGAVHLVNPHHTQLEGHRCAPSISAIPSRVDLAVIATPAATVPGIIGECVQAGAGAAVVISAGFRETGPAGMALEERILEEARRGGMRIVGPNCLGVMNPHLGLNATFANAMARPGNVGFLSQSGALCTAILDWSLREMVGFSAFCSTGSMLDVGWGDLIDHLGDDPATRSIVIYMESVGDARSFLSAAREVALKKPVIVLKAGRTEAAAKAAATHTGSLTGGDEVIDAAFRRCGVLRVNNISDIFYMTEVLAHQPRPSGPRLLIVTNAGGPGVLATDTLLANGGELAELSRQTRDKLNEFLPAHWSRRNPIDILGDSGPNRYRSALEVAVAEKQSDGLLVIMAPQGVSGSAPVAEVLARHAKIPGKPVLASWMGGASADAGVEILNRAGIPTFSFPDSAARAFSYLWQYSQNLRALYETPSLVEEPGGCEPGRDEVRGVIEAARAKGRELLTEAESKTILACYGIPVAACRVASDEDGAVSAAGAIGYPVVLKVNSESIVHKSDFGGVQLDLRDAAQVRQAFGRIRESVAKPGGPGGFGGGSVQPMVPAEGIELILGSSSDPQFGPVLLFGAGGRAVEVFQDHSLALPPLNTTLARRAIERTRIFRALLGFRGAPPADLAALESVMVKFSRLVVEQPWLREVDINPLLATPTGIVALDARIVLYPPDADPAAIPAPTIRPYPSQYSWSFQMRNGVPVVIRPIRPEDEPMLVAFHHTLSDESVYFRYFHGMKLDARTAHDRLVQICFIDYDRQIALIAERTDPATGERAVLGVARLYKSRGRADAECAFLVSDSVQHQGLGGELARCLIQVARAEGLKGLWADVLVDNAGMQRIFQRQNFELQRQDREVRRFHLDLNGRSG